MNALIASAVLSAQTAALSVAGETVSYQSAAGTADPVDVVVVWSDDEAQMPQGVRATIWTTEANFGGALIAKGDIVTRGNFRYRVVDPQGGIAAQRDGYGGITLYLKQVGHAPDA